MNPDYLWLTDALELLTLFVIAPALAFAIAYAAWPGKRQGSNPERCPMLFVVSGVTAVLLFVFAKWLNADVRSPQYFLQLACMLISGLAFGVFMGCGISVILASWRWHKRTRL